MCIHFENGVRLTIVILQDYSSVTRDERDEFNNFEARTWVTEHVIFHIWHVPQLMKLLDNLRTNFLNCWIVAQDAAKSVRFLKHLRITHVLNTAEGQDDNLVDLSAAHYEGTGIEYKVSPWSRNKLRVRNVPLQLSLLIWSTDTRPFWI